MSKKILSKILVFLLFFVLISYPVSASAETTSSDTSNPYEINGLQSDILIGESMTITVNHLENNESISFKSEDSSILDVSSSNSSSCVCTGKTAGTTRLSIEITKKGLLFFNSSTVSQQYEVRVSPKAVSIKFTKKKYKLIVNKKLNSSSLILRPSITTETPTYSSSNPDVVKIKKNGKIVAKEVGTSVITATIDNGVTARCIVVVSPPKTKQKKSS